MDSSKDKKSLSENSFYATTSTNNLLSVKSKVKIDYNILRSLRNTETITSICIETLKHTIVKLKGSVVLRNSNDNLEDYRDEIEYLENLFNNPNNEDSKRDLLLKIVEDILTIDRGVV